MVQRQVLYLGEINDSQREAWIRAIRVFDETAGEERELSLFSAATSVPDHAEGHGVRVRLDAMELHRPRQWGACWLAALLWNQLRLDDFWRPLLASSREGMDWTKVLQILTIYRLIDPGSEWRLHRDWFDGSLTANLTRAAGANISTTIEQSPDLQNWTASSASLTGTDPQGPIEIRHYRVPARPASMLYLRARYQVP